MTLPGKGGSLGSALLRRGCIPAIFILAGPFAASASDGDLQRVLLEQGCVEPQITTLLKQEALVIYRANCLGTSHKVIDITCTDRRCIGSRLSGKPEG